MVFTQILNWSLNRFKNTTGKIRLSVYFLIFTASYKKTERGSPCDERQYEITSEVECKLAGDSLGLSWGVAYDGNNDFPACLYADDSRKKVYYNSSPTPKRTDFKSKYSAICNKKGRKYFLVLTIQCRTKMKYCILIYLSVIFKFC